MSRFKQQRLNILRDNGQQGTKTIQNLQKKAIIEAVQAYRRSSDVPLEALVACPNEFQSESPPAAAAASPLSSPSTKSTIPF
jgi:hypothetical protein